MLKCDVLNKTKDSVIKFEDLGVGDCFIIQGGESGLCYEWIGMKVSTATDWEEDSYYIMDLSDEIGYLYADVDNYNIVKLIDLKVVEDEGDE